MYITHTVGHLSEKSVIYILKLSGRLASIIGFCWHRTINLTKGDYITLLLFLFLCFAKICLSHRSQVETKCGLGALQHSLWPNIRSSCLAIWTKALWFLCESMNFHPDKQLFQVARTGDWTTDPWITRPVLYPYTTQPAQKKPHPNETFYTKIKIPYFAGQI